MANGDNLPYNGSDLDVVPFTPITSEWGDGIGADILALAAGTGLDPDAITTPAIAGGAVTAEKLSTSALLLGYATKTSNQSTSSTTAVQVTGLSVTVTIPSGGRAVRITGYVGFVQVSGISSIEITIWDGAVGAGTQLAIAAATQATSTYRVCPTAQAIVTPSAGSKTYNIGLASSGGNSATLTASATAPSFILVELL